MHNCKIIISALALLSLIVPLTCVKTQKLSNSPDIFSQQVQSALTNQGAEKKNYQLHGDERKAVKDSSPRLEVGCG
jgi:hypothetical protein